MEARRRVELTGTNRSIGLIALIIQGPIPQRMNKRKKSHLLHSLSFAGLVAFGKAIRPDPIPNSAVKRFRANGTMSQDLGE